MHVYKAVTAPIPSTYPHVARWYSHITSYSVEFDTLPGSSTAGQAFTQAASAAPPAAAEEEEEIDLFGEDEEEDAEAERIKAERVAAYAAKKANKPKTIAKVRTTLMDVDECQWQAHSLLSPWKSSPGMTRPTCKPWRTLSDRSRWTV